MQKYNYHTHTTYSDGQDNVERMLEQAVKLGWTEIGISDHLIVYQDFPQSPSWKRMQKLNASFIYRYDFDQAIEFFINYRRHIRDVSKNYALRVYIGAEVDFFPFSWWKEGFAKFRREVGLDYYISGNHFLLTDDDVIIDPDDLENCVPELSQQQKIVSRHFKTITDSVNSGLFDFVAHLDYMRRVKICSDKAFYKEKIDLIRALAQNQVSAELSTKGLRRWGEMFPTRWMLDEMQRQNVPVLISDDAHQSSEMGFEFARAEQLLASLNYTNRWKLLKD